jgi:hypothetical protein
MEVCNMPKAPTKRPYVVTMYADDEKKYAFYQCSIGKLSRRQREIFLNEAEFCTDPNHANQKNRQEMTKLCICCFGAIYVVESEKTFNHRLKYGYCKTKPETNISFLKAPGRYKRLKNQPHFRDMKPHRREILEAMEDFEDIANEIRDRFKVKDTKQISESPTDEQETVQQKKEQIACELWIEGLSKSKIAEQLKERCNLKVAPGPDALTNWAKNHWRREHPDKLFPKRKAGRRTGK